MQNTRLLLIEEDEISREVLQMMLEDSFSLTVANNHSQANKMLFDNDYDIVLLDVSSDKADGLSMCRAISGDCLTDPPFVVALGNQIDDQSMRRFFEVGVYDYFVRPFNVVLFHESMHRLGSHIQAYLELKENDKSSQHSISAAVTKASFYELAFKIVAEINGANTNETLANAVLYQLSQRGIHCAIQIIHDDGGCSTFEEDKNVVGERTLQVFDLTRNQGNVIRFGSRLVFNNGDIALLVKSMDEASEVAYESLLSVGAQLINSMQVKLLSFKEKDSGEQLQKDMKTVIEYLMASLHKQEENTQQLINNVTSQIHASIDKLHLTEEQENFFIEIVEKQLHLDDSEHNIPEFQELANTLYDKINNTGVTDQ